MQSKLALLRVQDRRRCVSWTLGTLISALFYDLSADKEIKIPTQGEKRERELRIGQRYFLWKGLWVLKENILNGC